MQIIDDLDFDPYDLDTLLDPHPVCRRLLDEAPVYYNPRLDFYALSRAEDVETVYLDRGTFISGRGVLLEMMKSGAPIPPGVVLMEDPPTHTIHRALLSRMFTPRAMSGIEEKIRQLCADLLDPFVGAGGFDIVEDFSMLMPSAVMCWLIGVPDEDQPRIRKNLVDMRAGDRREVFYGAIFAEYYDWRLEHPSDDIMTHLMTTEFVDEHGTTWTLTRQETLSYVSNVNGAGHDTTKLSLGWAAKLLAEHPDQRKLLVDHPSLIPAAIEEVLRYEPPTIQSCRTTSRDVELHGQTIPKDSIVALVGVAANRDEHRFADPDRFDVLRAGAHHLSFGHGAHYFLGVALARLEARVALEEPLKRFPEWDLDLEAGRFKPASEARGWDSLPVVIP